MKKTQLENENQRPHNYTHFNGSTAPHIAFVPLAHKKLRIPGCVFDAIRVPNGFYFAIPKKRVVFCNENLTLLFSAHTRIHLNQTRRKPAHPRPTRLRLESCSGPRPDRCPDELITFCLHKTSQQSLPKQRAVSSIFLLTWVAQSYVTSIV